MSIGVNLMFNLTKQLTKILPDDANVEILDTHHKLKKDTPLWDFIVTRRRS